MPENKSRIAQMAEGIQGIIDRLYSNTYYTGVDNKKQLENLRKNMDTSISSLIDKSNGVNGANISKLYSRATIKQLHNDKKVSKSIEDLFGDQGMMDNVLSVYMDNKYIKDLDAEIDTICKYMPKLESALEIKAESVLSADDFSKEFVNVKNLSKLDNQETFTSQIEEIKRLYGLTEVIETAYMEASKYGEQYIYIVPYDKAFNAILNKKKENITDIKLSGGTVLGESTFISNDGLDADSMKIFNGFNLELSLNFSQKIESVITENAAVSNAKLKMSEKLISDDLEFDMGSLSQDGTIDDKKTKDAKLNINGCIIKRLPRANVIPIYIDEMCLGYYYIESQIDNAFEYVESLHDPIAGMKKTMANQQVENTKKDALLKTLSSQISREIDAKFINANQDIKKEIYLILKHNDLMNENSAKLNVTFIPPQDMVHIYFKKDQKTHRGISDLAKSLFPAKLYACLYISNSIGILTRSQDKRAYFVKQSVDTNISSLLINTVNQIKKSNFGMREIGNMNNILNITGRNNDYIIPVSQNGEKPIDFEIISGQDIDTKPELMETLEGMAINPTGVPLEVIEAKRSVEFSRQLTITNGNFARHILKRQGSYQKYVSDIITRVYNLHFKAEDVLEAILPPPSHLTMNNTIELIRSAQELTVSVVEMRVADKDRDQPWTQIFRKDLMQYHLASYVNWDNIDRIERMAKLKAKQAEASADKEDDTY